MRRLLRRPRPVSCMCYLVSGQPVVVTGAGTEHDPYVVPLDRNPDDPFAVDF